MPPRARKTAATRPSAPAADPKTTEAPQEEVPADAPAAPEDGEQLPMDTESDSSGGGDDRIPEPEGEPPCPECFPAGWPEGATSVGCGHGSWLREGGVS